MNGSNIIRYNCSSNMLMLILCLKHANVLEIKYFRKIKKIREFNFLFETC